MPPNMCSSYWLAQMGSATHWWWVSTGRTRFVNWLVTGFMLGLSTKVHNLIMCNEFLLYFLFRNDNLKLLQPEILSISARMYLSRRVSQMLSLTLPSNLPDLAAPILCHHLSRRQSAHHLICILQVKIWL